MFESECERTQSVQKEVVLVATGIRSIREYSNPEGKKAVLDMYQKEIHW